jgi:hypothetical protein
MEVRAISQRANKRRSRASVHRNSRSTPFSHSRSSGLSSPSRRPNSSHTRGRPNRSHNRSSMPSRLNRSRKSNSMPSRSRNSSSTPNRPSRSRNVASNWRERGSNKRDGYSTAAGRRTLPGSRIAPNTGPPTIAPGRSVAGMAVTISLRTVTTFISQPALLPPRCASSHLSGVSAFQAPRFLVPARRSMAGRLVRKLVRFR